MIPTPEQLNSASSQRLIKLLIGVLSVIVVLIALLIMKEVQSLHGAHAFDMNVSLKERRQHRTLTLRDVDDIRVWMTFGYLNSVFSLPPQYLQQSLHIEDAAYPQISLEKYAQRKKINSAAFLIAVQEAIKQYIVSNTAQVTH